MRDWLDYWNWWKTRRSQIVALVLLAGLIVWMNVALWQAERNYQGVLRELRQNYSHQEATREQQFTHLLSVVEGHLSRLDEETAEERKQQALIREMLDPLVKSTAKAGERAATSAPR